MTNDLAPPFPEEATAPEPRRRPPSWVVPALVITGVILFIGWEARSSRLQAVAISRFARKLTFSLAPGPTDSVVYPVTGPYDIRRGYTKIPAFTDTLEAQGFVVTEQARFSKSLLATTRRGIFPIYHEKPQAGLAVFDRGDRLIYNSSYPERLYPTFDSIPKPVIDALLFIENRELLEPGRPWRNPAVEWDRLARAVFDYLGHVVLRQEETPGGSTLATQIEKFRHSSEGRTTSPKDKLKQMVSATLRAYLDGPNTEESRREIVHTFVNSVPLAALPGYGEVNGLGDGLWAWFDTDFERTNSLLREIEEGAPVTDDQARAFKSVLALFIAHRRPSDYLIQDRERLERDTDAYLRLLTTSGAITPALRDRALNTPLTFRKGTPDLEARAWITRKAANAVRNRLLHLLDLKQLYDLDRVDLVASTTLDAKVQDAVTQTLLKLLEPAYADSTGLRGDRLLARGDPAGVIYSFTLYEATPTRNRLVVQADNYDQPLDINEGAKLDLGSTAKLRTLVTYLELVWHLQARYAGMPATELRRIHVDKQDAIERWAIDFLATAPDTTLPAMLDAAMNRTYSSSTGEQFFTSGGLLTFVNFDKATDGKIMTLRDATRNSVNLVYIRLMRDIVRHYTTEIPGFDSSIYDDINDPARQGYLERFADREGKQFLAKFLPRYRGKTPAEMLDKLAEQFRPTPTRLAVAYRSVLPDAPYEEFFRWAAPKLPEAMATDRALSVAYKNYPITAFDLADRGYIARVHPLELWLVGYLHAHPDAGWREIVEASPEERRSVYKWLFHTRYRESQNNRIRVLVEEEAFQKVHQAWKRQGYPFSSLVPSYATSIGSSADRPAALAELMGILVNDGVRRPLTRIDSMQLATGTPYEIHYEQRPVEGERVYPVSLARTVRATLADVVENGTARRVYGSFTDSSGAVIRVGGKTGTGDHRYDTFGAGGRLIESRVVNRTATFVFYIGDHFFGTLLAYVAGPKAAGYAFTSSLPVQILKSLSPALTPLIRSVPPDGGGSPPKSPGQSTPNHVAAPSEQDTLKAPPNPLKPE